MHEVDKGVSRPFAMSNYGIVTFPLVAAILFCGLLTTHATAKAVVGRRSALLPQPQLPQDAAAALRLFAPDALLRDDESNVLTSGGSSALSHFLHRLQTSRGSKEERQRMAAMLNALRMRLRGPSSGEEENNAVEEMERRPQWDKRLEVLENDGSSMADRRALEARRRMGPEFNPTGW